MSVCAICEKEGGYCEMPAILDNDQNIKHVCYGKCIAEFRLGLDRESEASKKWLREYLKGLENGSGVPGPSY